MSVVTEEQTAQATGFGPDDLVANAVKYREAKRMVDAASRFDSKDDAIAALDDAWSALENQAEVGSEYTPASELGFGSDNAATIALGLLGRRKGIGETRKQFNAMGKE